MTAGDERNGAMARRSNCRSSLTFERCETRQCLAAIAFGSENWILDFIAEPENTIAADLDGDEDVDLLLGFVASQGLVQIGWYENADGKGSFGQRRDIGVETIYSNYFRAKAIPADLDGDADLDVLTTSVSFGTGPGQPGPDATIAWYENMDGKGNFGARRVIVARKVNSTVSATPADLDRDGDTDLIVTGYAGVWYENVDGKGSFGPPRTFTTLAETVVTDDIDGDGDLDAFGEAYSSVSRRRTITWYKNIDGKGNLVFQQEVATQDNSSLLRFRSVDLDGDNDLDLLVADWRGVRWHENLDGIGNFVLKLQFATRFSTIDVGDVDKDGDLDVIGSKQWYENVDGKGNFRARQEFEAWFFPATSLARDVDSDGDVDILSTTLGEVVLSIPPSTGWYENTDGKGNFGPRTRIGNEAMIVHADDVDGDGDLDVITASSRNAYSKIEDTVIAWHENTDGNGGFRQKQVIAAGWIGTMSIGDVDGDRDPELLFAYHANGLMGRRIGKVGWYEITNLRTPQDSPRVFDRFGAQFVHTADVDGDGDLDVLTGTADRPSDLVPAEYVLSITLYVNVRGQGGYISNGVIDSGTEIGMGLFAADVDGDGDLDLLSSSAGASYYIGDRSIGWYENTDGKGNFGDRQVITRGIDVGGSIVAGDVEGDGDQDLILRRFHQIAWYENTDGQGTFGPQRLLIDQLDASQSIRAADMDQDGDIDLLSDNAWYENTDGKGTFGQPRIISSDAIIIDVGDMDRDGDLDVFAANAVKLVWYENVGVPGDANGDGRFDSSDLVQIAQLGEYEDDIAGNSTKADGDFNGDGDFTTADLVFAFEEGTYSPASVPSANRGSATLAEIARAIHMRTARDETKQYEESERRLTQAW
jgi:hypothetical protein